MASLKEINLRLASLASTKKITQAMKLIAITKLNKFQSRIRQAINYHHDLNLIFDKVLAYQQAYPDALPPNPLWESNIKSKKVRVLLFTSDRGLCGSFNTNVIKVAHEFVKEQVSKEKEVTIDTYGKKGFEFFSRRKLPMGIRHGEEFSEKYQSEVAHEFAKQYLDGFLGKEFDELYVVYNAYISAISQNPTVRKVLPFTLGGVELEDDKSKQKKQLASGRENTSEANETFVGLFEPDLTTFTSELVKRFVEFEFYFSFLNSTTGEHAARMTSMDSATKNCSEMIDDITLERNRVRQAAITKELIEIISGAESV